MKILTEKKNVRQKSRECHNHKPQPFPDTKRKRTPTIQTSTNQTNVRKALRLAPSSPTETCLLCFLCFQGQPLYILFIFLLIVDILKEKKKLTLGAMCFVWISPCPLPHFQNDPHRCFYVDVEPWISMEQIDLSQNVCLTLY